MAGSGAWILMLLCGAIALSAGTEDFRLPNTVIPFHYKLKILTKLTDDFSYNGKVWIDVEALTDVNQIVLNAKNLKIYDNETTVEELTPAALETIFNMGKTTTKKKMKRSAGEEEPADEAKNSETMAPRPSTENVMMVSGESPVLITPVHGSPFPHISGIDIKDVKLANRRPGNSPIKYIYYTLQKPSAESGSDTATKFGHEPSKVTVSFAGHDYYPAEGAGAEGSMPSRPQMVVMSAGNEHVPDRYPAFVHVDAMSTPEMPVVKETATEMGTPSHVHSMVTPGEEAPVKEATTSPHHVETMATEGLNVAGTAKPVAMMPHTTAPNTEVEHSTHGAPVSSEPKPVSHEYNPEKNFVTINLQSPLLEGKKYRIQLRFRGVLSDSLTGFHRVSYRKRNSKKASWLASTVFEPNEARSAFPCFDEPHFKATFDIALAHDKKFTALSNMPVKTISAVDGRSDYQWTIFERTPRMSTYLIAFLISDLQSFTPKLTPKEGIANTTYRFWARQDVLHRTRYAAKIVPDMKNYLERLLGVPDIMPKYDFVALPSFISNALENWGLVSFAEKNILYTPGFSSVFSKFETTQILGHEVSHIWFGNLVTPKYWDQIWLSEGFSNYFEVVAADHVQPTWDVKTISLVFSYLKVFSLDAMHSSHPLVPTIKALSDMNEIFDSISYQKGYFMVRMLNYTLGEETFMKGIRHYLSSNKLSNVDENDLWDAMTLYAHADGTLPKEYHLRDIMRSWTRKTGYPVIDVFRDYDNQTAVVTQRRFLRPKFDLELRKKVFVDEEQEETKWWIPLTYTTGKELNFHDTKTKVWIDPMDEETLLTDMPEENHFVLMNIEASGLYRVNYDERNWELVIDLLLSENYTDISVINRVQIIDDLLDFARAGEMSYVTAFEAANYLKKEKNFLPWKAALSNFEFISRMFRSTESNRLFKKFVRSLVSDRFDELGIDPKKNETILDAMNRRQIVKWACTTGLRQCTRRSLSLFRKWTEEKKPDVNSPIPSTIRSVVYCSAIAHGGAKDWQFLWNRYVNNIEVSDKMAIINGLGCSRNTRTLRKYLDWSLDETSGIRKQDSVAVFKAVARNDVGFTIAKDFLRTRMGDVQKYLGNNPFYVSQMVEALASKMNQESHLHELEAMEEEHFSKLRSAPRSFKRAKERVSFNIDWLEQNYDPITDWLKKQKF